MTDPATVPWRRVLAVRDAPDGAYRLSLDCGHERNLKVVARTKETREGLLVSTVPCLACGLDEGGPEAA